MNDKQESDIVGWKAISEYVNLSERHLRRMATDGTLKIQRKGTGERSPVLVSKKDLEKFKKSYWEKHEKKENSPYWIYSIPSVLLMVLIIQFAIPMHKEDPYYKTLSIDESENSIDNVYFYDQNGNKCKTIGLNYDKTHHRTNQEHCKESIVWCPHIEETPVFLDILTSKENQILLHQLNFPDKVWIPETPWISKSPALLTKIFRLKTPAYDGVGILWQHQDNSGSTLQIFNRKKELIGELFCNTLIDTICYDRRNMTLCLVNGQEETFNLWEWIFHQKKVIRRF